MQDVAGLVGKLLCEQGNRKRCYAVDGCLVSLSNVDGCQIGKHFKLLKRLHGCTGNVMKIGHATCR